MHSDPDTSRFYLATTLLFNWKTLLQSTRGELSRANEAKKELPLQVALG